MSAVTHLMLDVDGVLVTGRPTDGLSWDTDLKHDMGVAPADLARAFFEPFWADIVTGKAALLPCLEQALQSIGADVSAEEVQRYWFSNDARLEPNLLDLCADVRTRGISVFLATNQDHARAAYLMDQLGLAAHVDGLLHSAGLGVRKPDRAFFEAARSRTGADACAHLFVDDSATNVEAAREFGWQAMVWRDAGDLDALRGVLA